LHPRLQTPNVQLPSPYNILTAATPYYKQFPHNGGFQRLNFALLNKNFQTNENFLAVQILGGGANAPPGTTPLLTVCRLKIIIEHCNALQLVLRCLFHRNVKKTLTSLKQSTGTLHQIYNKQHVNKFGKKKSTDLCTEYQNTISAHGVETDIIHDWYETI